MGPLGFTEILIIAGIIILLFGAKKIPELMRGLGKGMREFKEARHDDRPQNEQDAKPKDGSPAVLATSERAS